MNRGHAYIGCQYGVHRTNAALVYNYVLNNPNGKSFASPSIARINGDRDINNTINFLFRKVWKTLKVMSPEEKAELKILGDKSELFEKYILRKVGELKRNVKCFR